MTRRSERVQEAIRRLVSSVIHDKLKDPRIGFITITAVEVTADLRNAKIFYSVLGDDKVKKNTKAGLESAKRYLKTAIGHELKLKFTPEIIFMPDKAAEYSQRIENLLDDIKKEREDGDGGSGEGDKA